MLVCYSAAFCQLCFYNKDWIGLDWIVGQRNGFTARDGNVNVLCSQC